jgi:hypothetical protein
MNEDTYCRGLEALRSRRPLLMAAAADHVLRMVVHLPGLEPAALRRCLWLELVWACRVWQRWGGQYA